MSTKPGQLHLFEETLRRIADEPDPERRNWLKSILLKVIDQPKEHARNRLFLRLVGELSGDAHKVLTVLCAPLNPADRQLDRDNLLASRAGVPLERIGEALEDLARAGLLDRSRFNGPDPSKASPRGVSLDTVGGLVPETQLTHGQYDLTYMFTRLGRDFMEYRRG